MDMTNRGGPYWESPVEKGQGKSEKPRDKEGGT